jgi:hypothetical protein
MSITVVWRSNTVGASPSSSAVPTCEFCFYMSNLATASWSCKGPPPPQRLQAPSDIGGSGRAPRLATVHSFPAARGKVDRGGGRNPRLRRIGLEHETHTLKHTSSLRRRHRPIPFRVSITMCESPDARYAQAVSPTTRRPFPEPCQTSLARIVNTEGPGP